MTNWVSFTKTWHSKPYATIDPTRPELNAAGKFVAITGGGTGIGKSMAVAFAQAGASTVAILGRRLDKLEAAVNDIAQASGGKTKVIFETSDISKRDSVDTAVKNLVNKAGGANVDVLICNAGYCPTPGTLLGSEENDFRQGLDLNIMGAFNTLQAFAPVLATNAYVFNTSSGSAHVKPVPTIWAYATAKLAAIKIFEYFQMENPELHVVQIQPGVIMTEMTEGAGVVDAAPDDPALAGQLSVWLTSPEAKFLKGKYVWANWDVDELKARAEEIQNSPTLLKLCLDGVAIRQSFNDTRDTKMATTRHLKTLQAGDNLKMDLLVDQDSEKYSAVCTYDGTLGGEPFFVPPHWHKYHDEHITVLEGRMTITLDGKATVATPETGTMFIPRWSVHSFRGFPGEKTVFEERNQPSGEYKALFFNDVFQCGKPPNLWLALRAAFDGDLYASLPFGSKVIDQLFISVFGFVAKLFAPAKPKTL
uniref:Cupin type-2 domain-containing protein n=1 Tax=Gibberella zeae TaxID=5518 RepID=A0A4E9DU38_GIBZA